MTLKEQEEQMADVSEQIRAIMDMDNLLPSVILSGLYQVAFAARERFHELYKGEQSTMLKGWDTIGDLVVDCMDEVSKVESQYIDK